MARSALSTTDVCLKIIWNSPEFRAKFALGPSPADRRPLDVAQVVRRQLSTQVIPVASHHVCLGRERRHRESGPLRGGRGGGGGPVAIVRVRLSSLGHHYHVGVRAESSTLRNLKTKNARYREANFFYFSLHNQLLMADWLSSHLPPRPSSNRNQPTRIECTGQPANGFFSSIFCLFCVMAVSIRGNTDFKKCFFAKTSVPLRRPAQVLCLKECLSESEEITGGESPLSI